MFKPAHQAGFNMVKVLFRQSMTLSIPKGITNQFLEVSAGLRPLCDPCLKGASQESKQATWTQVAPQVVKKVMYWLKQNFKLNIWKKNKHV